MTYREAQPSADLSHLVFSFWEFTTSDEDFGMIQHEIFPDGCISLLYQRNEKFGMRRLVFNALSLESITVPIFPTDVFWGMRLSPAACANILGENPANFREIRLTEAEKFPHLTKELSEKLDDCVNFDEAVMIYENHLRSKNFKKEICDEKVLQAVRLIEQTSGEIKISELAERSSLSVRQLERRFKNASGLLPKQFARTRRLRAAAVDLIENSDLSWANRAAEIGFTDQSHLIHEFVSLTKRSPNSFAEKFSHIKHGKLIK